MSPTAQRVLGVLILLITGIFSLPVVAYFLDGPSTENWIFPVQLILMAAIGAVVTILLPALARTGAPSAMRALTGAGWGVVAALVSVVVFYFLLSGFEGP